MGFDHILSGTRDPRKKGMKALNLGDRMDELKDRISHHARIPATLSLSSLILHGIKIPSALQKHGMASYLTKGK